MTGRTVEEAIEAALEQLGVAETDAEIVIVEEPRSGMFGLRRSGARIRARVRPIQPRAKRPSRRPRAAPAGAERGHRRQAAHPEGPARKSNEKTEGEEARGKAAMSSAPGTTRRQSRQDQGPGQNGSRKAPSRAAHEVAEATDASADVGGTPTAGGRQRSRSRGRGGRGRVASGSDGIADESSSGAGRGTGSPKEAQMSIETQQELATEFVREVVARFGIDATTTARTTEDDGIYISVDGENLGFLVGPKGATVEALQELTRTVVQRHTEEHTSRIVVDVGGYRERRAAALRQFVLEVAADVLRTDVSEALEPMSPSDRKVVHDTVNDLEGLETTSEGLEPRRYVIIRPAPAPSAEESSISSMEEGDDRPGEPADLS
ncbi:MAG: RNA-binding cell elongation regulator Jag/EloR [Acidimicrobiales bacterium]